MPVETQCPACQRNIKQAAIDYTLWVCTSRRERNFYTFTCPACQTPAAKRSNPLIENLLVAAGVKKRLYVLPLEIDDPKRSDPRPLSPDDHLDFLNEINAWDAA